MVDLVKIRKRAKQLGEVGKKPASKRSTEKATRKPKGAKGAKAKPGSSARAGTAPSKSVIAKPSIKTGGSAKKKDTVIAKKKKDAVIENPVVDIVVPERVPEVGAALVGSPVPEPAVVTAAVREPDEITIEKPSSSEVKDPPHSAPEILETPTPGAEERLDRFRETVGSSVVGSRTGVVDELENKRELLTFIVSDEQYAVSIDQIVEIITPRSVTRVPNSAETTVGIISLRGMIVTLLDIRKLLGHKPAEIDPNEARIVVVENQGEVAGFLVDRVSRVIKIDLEVIESHPVVSSMEQSEFVEGVFRYRENLMILLDLERLLSRDR